MAIGGALPAALSPRPQGQAGGHRARTVRAGPRPERGTGDLPPGAGSFLRDDWKATPPRSEGDGVPPVPVVRGGGSATRAGAATGPLTCRVVPRRPDVRAPRPHHGG